MHVYKIIFVLNTIHSCRRVDSTVVMNDDITYQQNNGQLIYAFVKAKDEDDAKEKAGLLIVQFLAK